MPYSAKFKEKMIAKMTGPNRRSATSLSKEVGIGQATLSRWLRAAKVTPMAKHKKGGRGPRHRRWPAEEKVRIVLAAAALGEDELGEFLRREGLHEADLERFREEVRAAATEGLRPKRRGLSPEQKKIRQLEKELARKEKALAEAAALLVLRKKAEAFFSGGEEGDTTGSSDE